MSFTSLVATMGNIITKHDNDTRVDVANDIFTEQILIFLRRRADDIDERYKSYYAIRPTLPRQKNRRNDA